MKILIDMGHPGHVHFFKHFIRLMKNDGHQVAITCTDKDVTRRLLQAYGLEATCLGPSGRSRLAKAGLLAAQTWRLFRVAWRFQPDIFLGIAPIRAAAVAAFLGRPCLAFDDTEHSVLENGIYKKMVSAIYTPTAFKKDMGPKQVAYEGYHALAHLHPAYFRPDEDILSALGLKPGEKYAVIRLVGWDAAHDAGQRGLDNASKRRLIAELKKHARVFITSEKPLPAEFQGDGLKVPPEKLHDVLYYASLCVSEGGTTAIEAAVLGTPTIHVSTSAKLCGVFRELHGKYGLLYPLEDAGETISVALDLITRAEGKNQWARRRERMLGDKIDVTRFMVEVVEKAGNENAG